MVLNQLIKSSIVLLFLALAYRGFSQCKPVASYPFNGNANDVSGNKNHGILEGATGVTSLPSLTFDRFNTPNSAYYFHGFANANLDSLHWIRIPDSPSLHFTNQISVSLWFKQCSFDGMDGNYGYSLNGYFSPISKGGDGGAAGNGLWSFTYVNNGSLELNFGNTNLGLGNSNFFDLAIVNCFDACEWINVISVVDSNIERKYINGKLVKQTIVNAADFTNANTSDLYIGRMGMGPNYSGGIWYPFHGIIDDVNIYNCALNQTQIDSLFGGYQDSLFIKDQITIDSVKGVYPVCGGNGKGSISIYPKPNNGPYSFSKDSGNIYQTSRTFLNLLPGTYNISIKSNCTTKDTVIKIIKPSFRLVVYDTICKGVSVFGHDLAGVYLDTILSNSTNGCDTLRTLYLKVDSTCGNPICGTPGIDGPSNVDTVVNTYFPSVSNVVVNAGSKSIQLLAVPPNDPYNNSFGNVPIAPGDLLLFIQVQDGTINTSNSNLYGSGIANNGSDGLGGSGYVNLGNVGKYEYAIAANTVPITGGLLQFYAAGAGSGLVNQYINYPGNGVAVGKKTFQVVRVPQYASLTLSKNINCPPFNGSVGGIIAFDVAGDFNCNGKLIDASETGLRGGYIQKSISECSNSNTYITTNTDYAEGKGEGIAGSPRFVWDGYNPVDNGTLWVGFPGPWYGRGAPANAGGGGNSHNAGGGGGGNAGEGGVGGDGFFATTCVSTPFYPNGGRPGDKLWQNLSRLYMGGGGGGGDVNNAITGVKGGVGGGIILINAGRMIGNGNLLSNGGNGQRGIFSIYPDGAGGGGAGGTMKINVTNNSPTSNLTIKANGGNGGNTEQDAAIPHGPGGGGGGGVIWYHAVGATIAKQTNAGVNGVTDAGNPGSIAHGAVVGKKGFDSLFTTADLPVYLQGQGSVCFPDLSIRKSELHPGVSGSRPAGNQAVYTLTINNTGGGAGGVSVHDSLPNGFTFDSAKIMYKGRSSGPITLVNHGGSPTNVLLDTFNIPGGDSVVIGMYVTIQNTVASGIYHNGAQVLYSDPTRTSTGRLITPVVNSLNGQFTSYESGVNSGTLVPGKNYDGKVTGLNDEDVWVIPPGSIDSVFIACEGDTIQLNVTPPALTPPFVYTWTGPAVFAPNNSVKNPTLNTLQVANDGNYSVVIKDANGFSSIYNTKVRVKRKSFSADNHSICKGQSYLGYNTTGTYTFLFSAANGCDSIVTLNLVVNPTYNDTTKATICEGDTLQGHTTTGCYTKIYKTVLGCDSSNTLCITVKPKTYSTQNVSVCSNKLPYQWNGNNYNISGTYYDTIPNAASCDSIMKLILTVKASPSPSSFNVSICRKLLPYVWSGNNYNTTGAFIKTFTSIVGCDSVVTLNLRVYENASSFTNVDICNDLLPYLWNGDNYFTAGRYTKTLVNVLGCDSVATLALTVSQKPRLNVPAKVNLCENSTASINAIKGLTNYTGIRWNTGSTQPILTVSSAGSYSVTVTNKCGDTTANIEVEDSICYITIPNSFSPNGDGINDTWKIRGIENRKDNIVQIYNRYGSLIFEKKGYNNNNRVWNGSYNDKPMPVGVYYYLITLKDITKPLSGWVTLLK